jgi:hypothetical protein
MKYTLKKPDGTEVTLSRDDLVIGYNRGEIDVGWQAKPQGASEWARVGVLIGVESAIPPQGTSTSADAVGSITTSLWGRYHDAYLIARATAAIGQVVKSIGVGLRVIIALGAVVLATQTQGSQSAILVLGGVIAGAVVAIPLFVLGILVAAQGQVLKAALDAAVHTSPFLQKEDMTRIMSL